MPFETKLKKKVLLLVSADIDQWSGSITYSIGDYCHHKDGSNTPVWFQSLEDNNLNNEPSVSGETGSTDTHWKFIGSSKYIYEEMPVTISTQSDDDIFPLSIENAYYLIENNRKENSIEETFSGGGISKSLCIKADYQIRTSGK